MKTKTPIRFRAALVALLTLFVGAPVFGVTAPAGDSAAPAIAPAKPADIAATGQPSPEKKLPPKVGDTASNFTLKGLDGKPVELKDLTAKKTVLLTVLRGWPGYQCPICTALVRNYILAAPEFAKRNVQLLFVYPGPAEELTAHAEDFLKDKAWPKEFLFVIDPAYTFTNAYALRWDAKNETAYPSSFIIDKENKIRFAHISHTHADRVEPDAALKALDDLKL
jgi:peroxiredoxin